MASFTFASPPSYMRHGIAFTIQVQANAGDSVTALLASAVSGGTVVVNGTTISTSTSSVPSVANGAGIATFTVTVSQTGTAPAADSTGIKINFSATGWTTTQFPTFWVMSPTTAADAAHTRVTSATGQWVAFSRWLTSSARYAHYRLFVPNTTITATARPWWFVMTGSGANGTFGATAYLTSAAYSGGNIEGTSVTAAATTWDTFYLIPCIGTTSLTAKKEITTTSLIEVIDWLRFTVGHNIDSVGPSSAGAGGKLVGYSAGSGTAAYAPYVNFQRAGFIAAAQLDDFGVGRRNTVTTDGFQEGKPYATRAEIEAGWAADWIASGIKMLYAHGACSDSMSTTPNTEACALASDWDGTGKHGLEWFCSNTQVKCGADMTYEFPAGTPVFLAQDTVTPAPTGSAIAASRWFAVFTTGDGAGVLTTTLISASGAGYATEYAAGIAAMAATLPAGDPVCLTIANTAGSTAWTPGTSSFGGQATSQASQARETFIMRVAASSNLHLQVAMRTPYKVPGDTSTLHTLAARTVFTLGAGTAASPAKTIKAGQWGCGILFADAAGALSIVWDSGNSGAGYATETLAIQSAALQTWPASARELCHVTFKAGASDWHAGTDAVWGGTGGTPAVDGRCYDTVGILNYFARAGKTFVRTAAASQASATVVTATDPFAYCEFGSIAAGHSYHSDMSVTQGVTNTAQVAWLNTQAFAFLAAPTLNAAANITNSGADLSWSAATAGAGGYTYQAQTNANGAGWVNAGPSTGSLAETLAGLTAGTPYQVRIVVTDTAGSTATSNAVSFTPLGASAAGQRTRRRRRFTGAAA